MIAIYNQPYIIHRMFRATERNIYFYFFLFIYLFIVKVREVLVTPRSQGYSTTGWLQHSQGERGPGHSP